MARQPFSYTFYKTTNEAWDAMYQALLTAKKSIYWEVYIFVDDRIGKRFVEILGAKAQAGVEVKLIIDAIGSFYLSKQAEQSLHSAGVELLKFNRLYPEWRLIKWLTRIFYRNHRKVLIIDEKQVFLGGVNIEAKSDTWDDLYVQMNGSTPWPLLRGFAKSYVASGGDKKNVRHLLHPKLVALQDWREQFRYVLHSPRYKQMPLVRKLYIRALSTARESVNLISPYYVPDRAFLKALREARDRGVKVNIFLPLRTDHRITELITRAYVGLSAKAGANIFFLPKMNHGKALTIDDTMGIVGSHNLSRRGVSFDRESAVHFTHGDMVRDLNKIFAAWKEKATPFNEASWRRRGLFHRLQEWLAKKFENFV